MPEDSAERGSQRREVRAAYPAVLVRLWPSLRATRGMKLRAMLPAFSPPSSSGCTGEV